MVVLVLFVLNVGCADSPFACLLFIVYFMFRFGFWWFVSMCCLIVCGLGLRGVECFVLIWVGVCLVGWYGVWRLFRFVCRV